MSIPDRGRFCRSLLFARPIGFWNLCQAEFPTRKRVRDLGGLCGSGDDDRFSRSITPSTRNAGNATNAPSAGGQPLAEGSLDLRYSGIHLITRAGLPATIAPAGTSLVTTLPAPTMARSPIVMPQSSVAPEPMDAPRLTSVGMHCQSASV